MCCSLNHCIIRMFITALVMVHHSLTSSLYFWLMLMMMKCGWVWLRQLSAAGGPTAQELWIDDRAVSGTYLTAMSSAVSPSNSEMHIPTCTHRLIHTYTWSPHSVHDDCLQPLFGSHECITSLWLNNWRVYVCVRACFFLLLIHKTLKLSFLFAIFFFFFWNQINVWLTHSCHNNRHLGYITTHW